MRFSVSGHVPGLCISINLQVDHDYIVYLRKSADGKLTHDQVVPDEGVDSYIDEVLSSDCASVSFPTGNPNLCPHPYRYLRCVSI